MDRRKKLRRVVHSAGHSGLENDEIGKDIMIRDYDIMSVFISKVAKEQFLKKGFQCITYTIFWKNFAHCVITSAWLSGFV